VATDRRGDARRTAAAPDRELFSAADVTRTVARIAHQIIEKTAFGPENPADLVIVGIPTGGAVLARRLADTIAEFTGVTPAVGTVDPTLYRDDLRRGPARPLGATALPDGGLDDRLVAVDDMLFSGRTVRAALDALGTGVQRGAAGVLVDRGHRELIRADYVGRTSPPRMKVDHHAADRDRQPRRAACRGAEGAGAGREAPAVRDRPDAASATALLDTATGSSKRLGREVRKRDAARARSRHDVLRELHAHPRLLRGRGQVDERGHDQRVGEQVVGRQGSPCAAPPRR
jgi:pyrimidine operon attenuation protein/uracil phosphoribosyltransferase